MKKYDHSKIEKKWQKYWEVKKMYRASDKLASVKDSKKFYTLVEFYILGTLEAILQWM